MFLNDDQIIKKLEEVNKFKFSDEQLQVLKAKGGIVLVCCAGSGKTTMLINLIAKRILSGEIHNPDKLLCTTYSKAGADEMSARLNKLLKRLGLNYNITIKTLHASYYQVLKRFGLMKNIISNAQRKLLIKEACTENNARLEEEDLNTLDSLLSYQINYLMTDKQLINSYVYTLENVSEKEYTAIRQAYNKKKEEHNLIDFDDMQLYMYSLLCVQKNQMVLNYCRSQWEYFYVDEFQDTSKIQFAIMQQMATDSNKVMVIGDDDQCIYSWRGADPNIILNICAYYDLKKYYLNTNYRCGDNIVKVAEVGIKKMSRRENKEMKAYRTGGKIEILPASGPTLFQLSMDAYKHIKRELAHGARLSDICVLARNNSHVAILGNLLLRDGIYCTAAEDMKISNLPLFKDLVTILEMSKDTYNAHLVKNMLWKVTPYLGLKGAEAIYNFMQTVGCSLKDALGYVLTRYRYRRDIPWSGNIKLGDRVDMKLSAQAGKINFRAETGLVKIYTILTLDDPLEKIKALFYMFFEGVSFLYNNPDRMRTLKGMIDYFEYMCTTYGIEDTEAFLRLTQQYESGNMAVTGEKITLSTVHGAKGMEWRYVIQFADDNISFPSFDGINKMLSRGISEQDIYITIDEERRLHYVAQTRAIEKWTLLTYMPNISVLALEAFNIIPQLGGHKNNGLIISWARSGSIPKECLLTLKCMLEKESCPYTYAYDEELQKETESKESVNTVGDESDISDEEDFYNNSDVFITSNELGYTEENEFWGIE